MKSNLVIRALSGLAYVVVMVGCLVLGMNTYCVLFAVITAVLLNEFNTLLANHGIAYVNNMVTVTSGVYLFLAMFLYVADFASAIVFLPYVLSFLFIIISGLYTKQGNPVANWAYSFAGQLYVALPMSLLNVLAFNGMYDYILPLAVFVFLWLNDTGAYCFGCSLSKKIPYKLFPSVSPNKSWVGSVGGAITVMIGACCFYYILGKEDLWFWIGFGLTVCVFGTWGDLVESQLKRQLGIKDSGKFLPGHGGALDRFDSALLAIPAAVVYVALVASNLSSLDTLFGM